MERDLSVQTLSDAKALRALAHPLRLDLMEAISVHGSLCATEAAEIVGESPANCSWHLRQLAKYGYLEEVPGTSGRQRPWRRTGTGLHWEDSDADPDVEAASHALTNVFIDRHIERIKRARDRRQPDGWQDAALAVQAVTWLTVEENAELNEQISRLVLAHKERVADPAKRPPGARPIRVIALSVADDSLGSSRTGNDGGDHA